MRFARRPWDPTSSSIRGGHVPPRRAESYAPCSVCRGVHAPQLGNDRPAGCERLARVQFGRGEYARAMRGGDRVEEFVTTDLLAVWTDPDTAMEAVGASLGIFGQRVTEVRRVLATETPLRRAL